ncbi:hypothetical protein [Ruegeria lacuscaerulensis]|uniref:hypothetical protein n=1 Tax=Ruegeria lacuscaerulensis TaxID=55218 RepID=UPI00147B75B8|nr:hypothetical protein [Ruegeria lacuscaerulensis]
MKPLPLLILVLACSGCTNFPELEGRELANVKSARYPELIPLQENLGPPANPVSEAVEVEEDLVERRKELQKKARKLQRAKID